MKKKNQVLPEYKKLSSIKMQKNLLTIIFLLVPVFLLVIFTYIPFVNMVRYSFYRWDGISPMEFIGFNNYRVLFSNARYFSVIFTSVYYIVASINICY